MAEESALLGAVAAAGGAVGQAVGAVFAAEKALDSTLASAPGSGQKFSVTKETVLQAGKVIDNQIDLLQKAYGHATDKLRVRLSGGDEVNQDIAAAWNDRLVEGEGSYAVRVGEYIDSLKGLVAQLRSAAHQYGYTEEEVNAAMGSVGASH